MGNANEKSAVSSVTIWAQLLAIYSGLSMAIPEITQTILPVISAHAAGIVVAGTAAVTILRRVFGKNKDITTVLPQ